MFSKLLRFIPLLCLFCLPVNAAQRYPIPNDIVISMQRGNCEGGCPVYRVVIFADGDVLWQGIGHVAKRGAMQSHIEPDAIRSLINDFVAIDYFHLENIYSFHGAGCQSTEPDMPTVITSLSLDGEARTLSHHDGCVGEISNKLKAIENKIDEAAKTAHWITGKAHDQGR